jgi:hypothetical protein
MSKSNNEEIMEKTRFILAITMLIYCIIMFLVYAVKSINYQMTTHAKRNCYVFGNLSNYTDNLKILAGSVEKLQGGLILVKYATAQDFARIHKTMLIDTKNKKFQVLENNGLKNDKVWVSFSPKAEKIYNLIIRPEARYLYK